MFVRWKQRPIWTNPPRVGRQKTSRVLLVAVLVKSERRGGRPRQRTVAYLGSIEKDRTDDPGPSGSVLKSNANSIVMKPSETKVSIACHKWPPGESGAVFSFASSWFLLVNGRRNE
jgi:hypothetical protein